jgi:hypothetical protein
MEMQQQDFIRLRPLLSKFFPIRCHSSLTLTWQYAVWVTDIDGERHGASNFNVLYFASIYRSLWHFATAASSYPEHKIFRNSPWSICRLIFTSSALMLPKLMTFACYWLKRFASFSALRIKVFCDVIPCCWLHFSLLFSTVKVSWTTYTKILTL